MISPVEYQLALSTIVAEVVEISGDALVIETARLFGFDRTGPDLKEAIDRQADRLVNEGRSTLAGNVLRFAESALPGPGLRPVAKDTTTAAE